ncbi:HesA/MoeB/ThiF family protein [Longitalea luteola]|uniref:HesA/MoeB/ThiF family protein n=1 Tax=Longitalea luteola TaxID=2812563 RepID=UPI001A9776C9|nr:ThiF family adenylyltransferase [Longitalea luteola]
MRDSQHWYEAMPALCRAELETLQHGLSYFKFINQKPLEQNGKQIIILGELSYGVNAIQLVQVGFPHSFPYSPPEVYPLQQGVQIVGNNMQQALVPKNFNRGNQYSDGRMCLFRDEEEWIPFYNSIGMVMEQAVRWLETATSEKGFTTNLIVDENNPVIQHAGQLLYYFPAEFEDANGGQLTCKLIKENYYSLIQLQLNGLGGTKVINTFPDDTELSLTTKELIHGRWYRVVDMLPKDLLPSLAQPEGLKNFLALRLNVNINDILPEPQVFPKRILIGFRIGQTPELHCFQIFYWKEGLITKFQSSYLLPKNLTQELFVRIDALFNLESLAQKRILVIGSGAIGSEVIKELAASNIGYYVVIDDERFDVGNSVRHAGDLMQVGELKVDIAKKIIQGRNPQANVQRVPVNILRVPADLLSGLIDESDVVLDLTANRLVEEYLHQKVCNERGKILVQSAVSKGGLTGIVLVFYPGKSSCLECLKSQNLNQLPVSLLETETLKEAPADYGACSKPALPASGLDTREVALQTARVVVQILLQDEDIFYPKMQGFQYYWHGPAGANSKTDNKKHKPFEWEIQKYQASVKCAICKLKK